MKKININIYQFEELPPEVQKKIIDRRRYEMTSYEWWDIISLELSEDECYLAGIEPTCERSDGSKYRRVWECDTVELGWDNETPASVKFINLRVIDEVAFLQWMGIDLDDRYKFGYVFNNRRVNHANTSLEFVISVDSLTELKGKLLMAAEKFKVKVRDAFDRVMDMHEIMTSDENVREMLTNDGSWYYENGDDFERVDF